MNNERLYSLKEAALAAGKGIPCIKQAAAREQLLTTRLGNEWFVTESDLINYLNEYDPERADAWLQHNGEI